MSVHHVTDVLVPAVIDAVKPPFVDNHGNAVDPPESATMSHAVTAFANPAGAHTVCWRDNKMGCAYVDTLSERDDVGKSNALLSYSWRCKYIAVTLLHCTSSLTHVLTTATSTTALFVHSVHSECLVANAITTIVYGRPVARGVANKSLFVHVTFIQQLSLSDGIVSIGSALKRWVEQKGRKPQRTYIWVCALCLNQHRIEESVVVGSEELGAEFGSRVQAIGRLVSKTHPFCAIYVAALCMWFVRGGAKKICDVIVVHAHVAL